MKKSIINNIKKMLISYNEIIEHIQFLNAENKKLDNAIANLETLELCDNVDTAINALKAEIELNTNYIIDYTAQANEYEESIENNYDENRDYKIELKQDAIATFRLMIDNATSDFSNGYSFEYFDRMDKNAHDWLTSRMKELDVITNNQEAFAFMINMGIGEI